MFSVFNNGFFHYPRNERDTIKGGLIMKNLKSRRKFKSFLATALLALMTVVSIPANTVIAADLATKNITLLTEMPTSYVRLVENEVMPLSSTTYFIQDKQFSFSGTFIDGAFSVPSACEARMVIAVVGSDILYVDVMNGKGVCERTITVPPNQAQVHVFNINSGTHYLRYRSAGNSINTVRMQLYTWDY